MSTTERREAVARAIHAATDLTTGYTDPYVAATAVLALLDGEVGREWQPIDTAPKDGTLILGWPQDGGGPVIVWWASHGEQFKDQDGWDTGECDGYGDPKPKEILTHWMPLPDAPRAARPEGQEVGWTCPECGREHLAGEHATGRCVKCGVGVMPTPQHGGESDAD